jgi:hypothetical protein
MADVGEPLAQGALILAEIAPSLLVVSGGLACSANRATCLNTFDGTLAEAIENPLWSAGAPLNSEKTEAGAMRRGA